MANNVESFFFGKIKGAFSDFDLRNIEGAFYVLPDASASLNGTTIKTSVDLCLYLLDTAGVGIVEGDSFGAPDTVRISYATSDDKLLQAVDRIAKALSSN